MNGAPSEANGVGGRARLAYLLVAGLGLGACLGLDWPGHFSVDSISQLAQGRIGIFDDWHPPVMAWLLGLADRVIPGAPLFFTFDAILAAAALLAFALGSPRPRLRGLPVLACIFASPQMLVFQGVAWKDLLFADATLAGFAALAVAGRTWARPLWRNALLGCAFVLFLTAALARQTGFVSPLAGALVLAGLYASRGGGAGFSRRGGIVGGGGALGALAALWVAANLATALFAAHGDGRPAGVLHARMLQTYDLAGALRRDPRLPLEALHRAQPALEWFERVEAAPRYTAATIDFLDDLPAADALLPPPDSAVSADWMRLILRRPWLWVRVRTAVFLDTLASNPALGCPLVSTGIWSDDPVDLAHSGLRLRDDDRDDFADDYARTFSRTPVLSHVAWALCAIVLLGWALRDIARGDRRPELLSIAGLLVAALAFCAGFFVISVACDYRYLIVLDLAAMAAIAQRVSAGPVATASQAPRPTTAVARRSSFPHPTR